MKKNNLLACTIFIITLSFVNVFAAKAERATVLDDVTDVWEVEIIKKSTSEIVKTQTVPINSIFLEGLQENIEYIARVRTKNIVYSDWVTTDVFTFRSITNMKSNYTNKLIFSSNKGNLLISSDIAQHLDLYSINGRLIRSVNVPEGKTVVAGLETGLYLIGNQIVIVK